MSYWSSNIFHFQQMLAISNLASKLTRRLFVSQTWSAHNMASVSKKPFAGPYIATHDGTFHCDDVTACFMLKQLDRFKHHEIVRTRDTTILAEADIIVDVGGELDVERLRLDHHQRSFNQTIKDYHPKLRTTNRDKPPRLSSAGLVYALFGKDLIVTVLKLGTTYKELTDADQISMVDRIYERAYVEFIEEIDAIDNGVEVASCSSVDDTIVYNYHINTGISTRIGRLNPLDPRTGAQERLDRFIKAMPVVGAEIIEGITYLGSVWWQSVKVLKKQVLERKQYDASGNIVFLPQMITGWKQSLYDIEEELGIEGEIKFLIYGDLGTKNENWRCLTVPSSTKSFVPRLALKEEWRGKREDELQNISGITDATFVHMTGFTGGAKSEEGAKKLVTLTLIDSVKS